MKCEVARYIYDEKRLCSSILFLISLRRRPPRLGNGRVECIGTSSLELETSPYFFDHHDIPSRSRLMDINFRTSPEIKFRPRSFLLTYYCRLLGSRSHIRHVRRCDSVLMQWVSRSRSEWRADSIGRHPKNM